MNRMVEVTVQDASEFLGVTQRTVINYIRAKEIEAVKVGKSWFIKKPSLDSFSQRYGLRALTKSERREEPQSAAPKAEPDPKPTPKKTDKSRGGSNNHSVLNLRLFSIAKEVLKAIQLDKDERNSPTAEKINQLKLEALETLGAGYYSFDLQSKIRLYRRSRESIGGILALLHYAPDGQQNWELFTEKIEEDLLPAYSALIRRMEQKREKL